MKTAKTRFRCFLLMTVVAIGSGCGGGGGETLENVDVVSFVRNEIANTADDREPVEINQINFLNLELDDDTLYDALLDR